MWLELSPGADRLAVDHFLFETSAASHAGINKAAALSMLGRGEEELAVCDDVMARFGAVPDQRLREQVAMALDEPTLKKTVEEVQAWRRRVKRVRNEQP
jgi:hypothetical protein